MSIGWIGQKLEKRVLELEQALREQSCMLAELQQAVAAYGALDGRINALAATLTIYDVLEDRLVELEQHSSKKADEEENMITELTRLRSSLARLEKQRQLDMEENQKVGVALLERVERLRVRAV